MVKDFGAQREIAGQIQELKARIIVASQRRDRYTLDEVVVGSGSKNVVPIYPRLPALYVEATNLVGMDGPSEDLIRLVTDEDLSVRVVCVVGFGGSGKTTLANQVYKKIGDQFKCQAFVSVSLNPDIRKILLSLLSQVKNEDYAIAKQSSEETLIDALRDFLKDKRCRLVHIPLDSWSPPPHLLHELISNSDLCICKIPEWLTSLVNLNYIQISINRLRQETLHVLGDLPTLLCLTLYSHKTGPKERLVICNRMFQRLKRLVLWCEVGGLMFESGAMLSLEALEFQIMANEARSMCNAPDLGICYLSSLSDICVWIDCGDAKAEEVHALEGAIRASAKLLPNCPTPYFHRLYWRQ
ncbi:hypothetical protein HU200_058345 [Digitaria exilis]|uniref:NB-ARC domain-containing protein n=1 Tax=Digitaria exilis TaxID=1010633 RepID=A0A835DZ86_9POAL|nr:hypothetical protein HU200_058345 [Digitaria exilis]